jgi:hypothetical protein
MFIEGNPTVISTILWCSSGFWYSWYFFPDLERGHLIIKHAMSF